MSPSQILTMSVPLWLLLLLLPSAPPQTLWRTLWLERPSTTTTTMMHNFQKPSTNRITPPTPLPGPNSSPSNGANVTPIALSAASTLAPFSAGSLDGVFLSTLEPLPSGRTWRVSAPSDVTINVMCEGQPQVVVSEQFSTVRRSNCSVLLTNIGTEEVQWQLFIT